VSQLSATAPPAPLLDAHSVNSLIQNLKQSNQWTETNVLENWIKNGNIFIPQKLGFVFKCISGEYSYTSFPESIGEAMVSKLTCKHVSEAAIAVPEAYKAAVCYNFAKYCTHKHNAEVDFKCVGIPSYAVSLLLISYVYFFSPYIHQYLLLTYYHVFIICRNHLHLRPFYYTSNAAYSSNWSLVYQLLRQPSSQPLSQP
jgi:hypothetical protein